MYVLTAKVDKKKIAIAAVALIALIAVIIALCAGGRSTATSGELSVNSNGDRARFLGNDDYHRIAVFAETEGRSVARTEVSVDIVLSGERKQTACRIKSAA